jgi:hypothetical protein
MSSWRAVVMRGREMSATDLPRVTQIIKAAGLLADYDNIDPYYMERGTAVHLACQLYDENDLDPDSLTDDIRDRVEAYIDFRREMRVEIHEIELDVVHDTLRYAGRLDRIATINGRRGILDIKGPIQAPWHGVQLALYLNAYASNIPTCGAYMRWSVHVEPGGYKLIAHTSADDFAVARAALSLYHWKVNHSCLKSS